MPVIVFFFSFLLPFFRVLLRFNLIQFALYTRCPLVFFFFDHKEGTSKKATFRFDNLLAHFVWLVDFGLINYWTSSKKNQQRNESSASTFSQKGRSANNWIRKDLCLRENFIFCSAFRIGIYVPSTVCITLYRKRIFFRNNSDRQVCMTIQHNNAKKRLDFQSNLSVSIKSWNIFTVNRLSPQVKR